MTNTLLYILLALVALEALSWVAARVSGRFFALTVPSRARLLAEQSQQLRRLANGESVRAVIHPVLGWSYGASVDVTETQHLNALGLRGSREYAAAPTPGVTRIAVFGDSYTYCNEVEDADSWPALVESTCDAEVLNYGVGGYGTEQAFLRFRDEGARLKPQIVILGITSMMAPRVVSRYSRFRDTRDGPWFKPRFVLDGGALRFVPAPIASREDAEKLLAHPNGIAAFGRDDFWYNAAVFEHWLYPLSATYRLLACTLHAIGRRYVHPDRVFLGGGMLNPQSEAFHLITRVVQEFAACAGSIGAEPIVLMMPGREDVEQLRKMKSSSYEPLRAQIDQLGIRVIDTGRVLASAGAPLSELFAVGGHYAASGNAAVAHALAESLHLARRI